MLYKMATGITWFFILILAVSLTGFVYSFLNPNTDPDVVDLSLYALLSVVLLSFVMIFLGESYRFMYFKKHGFPVSLKAKYFHCVLLGSSSLVVIYLVFAVIARLQGAYD